jgi:rhodanese-related sulfurtransferase
MGRVDPATLRGWIGDGQELAILDAREEGEFGAAHLFWAVPCPLSRCELRAPALLPRLATRIVCVDDAGAADGAACRLAAWLKTRGAADVQVLAGGTAAWAAAGFVLFSGVNVPSKAFGEWVEHHDGTPSVDPPQLKQWLDSGRDMVVLDSRTQEEFRRMSIPSGISVPGGELVYRFADLVASPQTLVVVNCAGRTRSILGAASLKRAGVPNEVVALRNGTMGWELAGLEVARGRGERFAPGRPRGADVALERARGFAEAAGVGIIGPLDLARYEEDPARTCYVLDVRDPEEYSAAHRPGSLCAPGGQLVQATDHWIAVRGARIALIDDDGVRARMAGGWLRLMGHRDVFVVEGGLSDATIPGVGPDPAAMAEDVPAASIEATDLQAALARRDDVAVIDLARSVQFREGHIPGAIWGIRTRLHLLRDAIADARLVMVTSPDGLLARLAVPELQALTGAEIRAFAGGTAAWPGELAADRENPPDEACVDVHLRPYDRNSGVAEAMQAYLSWEIDLVREIERDGTVTFGVPTLA